MYTVVKHVYIVHRGKTCNLDVHYNGIVKHELSQEPPSLPFPSERQLTYKLMTPDPLN